MKGKLNNLMVQLRKNCNHPDLLESAFSGSCIVSAICMVVFFDCALYFLLTPSWLLLTGLYPPVEEIVEQCGKFRLLDRLLARLFARKHKVGRANCDFLHILVAYEQLTHIQLSL